MKISFVQLSSNFLRKFVIGASFSLGRDWGVVVVGGELCVCELANCILPTLVAASTRISGDKVGVLPLNAWSYCWFTRRKMTKVVGGERNIFSG